MVDPILIEQVLHEPAEERRRGDRQRPVPADSAADRAARARPAPHRRARRRGRVLRPGHRPRRAAEMPRAALYEAFYSTKTEGMGIGLKLCRSIVEAHHGRLQARNLYNPDGIVGCEFSFWIPVTEPLGAMLKRQRRSPSMPARQRRNQDEFDPEKGYRVRRGRRRGRARFPAVAARRQGLPGARASSRPRPSCAASTRARSPA